MEAVTLEKTEARPGRPPAIEVVADLTLRARADAPRWFLIGTEPRQPLIFTVTGLEWMEFMEAPGRGYLQLYGDPAEMLAYRLAPGSTLQLRGLAIARFANGPLDVWECGRVQLGSAPLEERFIIEGTLTIHEAANTRLAHDEDLHAGLQAEVLAHHRLELPMG